MRFAQLKIFWGETEAGGDGLCCLAIVPGRRDLVRTAHESQSKIVVALGAFGIDRDLLLSGCDSLLRGSDLMDLSPAQKNRTRDEKDCRSEFHDVPLRKSEGLRAPLRVECPETFGRFTELHHRADSSAALVCRWWVC